MKKEVWPDGYMIVYFNNKDIKQTFPDEIKVVYYFAEANTTQTTFKDGWKIFKFSNGQVEQHFPNGEKEITFPDGTLKFIDQEGNEESLFTDGTVQRIWTDGFKEVILPNG